MSTSEGWTINDLIQIMRDVDDSPTSRLGFDMQHSISMATHTRHRCGSACCIGGHAQNALGWYQLTYCEDRGVLAALQVFGLSEDDAYAVGFPKHVEAWQAKPHHAIALLEHLRDYGEVNWPLAMLAQPPAAQGGCPDEDEDEPEPETEQPAERELEPA